MAGRIAIHNVVDDKKSPTPDGATYCITPQEARALGCVGPQEARCQNLDVIDKKAGRVKLAALALPSD
jgi:hypothetical protein